MEIHYYWFIDNKGRISDSGKLCCNTLVDAIGQCHQHYEKDKRKRKRANINRGFHIHAVNIDTMTSTLPSPAFDLFIVACIESGLTDAQINMMLLLHEGKPNKIIADILYIGENGIETCQQKIYKKLNVHSRSEAVAKIKALADTFRHAGEREE